MISGSDLRKGTTFELDGQVYTVIDFLHVKPGKGAAFVRTKLRNVIMGGVTDRTFNPTDKLQEAISKEKKCNTFTQMENYTTSWIKKLSSKFL